MKRLAADTLPAVAVPMKPTYDRAAAPSIVHIGLGAFARAHLAVYADELLRAGWPATISAVSLRSTRAEEQLAPQDCLYSVTEREPGVEDPPRVIGSVTAVATGPEAALRSIGAATTKMVTLTVTEKGYDIDPGGDADPRRTRSAPTVVALGLDTHRRDGTPPPVVASLDNLSGNGAVLRSAVLAASAGFDPALSRWIAEHVAFPCSVVDRMVPATGEADLHDVSERLGVLDLAAVVAEHHRSWVIDQVEGLPPLADVGVETVADVGPYERRKLWLLNGPHSAVAYCGLLVGEPTIAAAVAHPVVAAFTGRIVEQVLEVASLPPAAAPGAFAAGALRRFGNPALGHTCAQVAADGSRKLPQRLLPVVSARRRLGLPTERFALVAAIWIAAVAGLPVRGVRLPAVDDPAAHELGSTPGHDVAAVALRDHGDRAFASEVQEALGRLAVMGAETLDDRP